MLETHAKGLKKKVNPTHTHQKWTVKDTMQSITLTRITQKICMCAAMPSPPHPPPPTYTLLNTLCQNPFKKKSRYDVSAWL